MPHSVVFYSRFRIVGRKMYLTKTEIRRTLSKFRSNQILVPKLSLFQKLEQPVRLRKVCPTTTTSTPTTHNTSSLPVSRHHLRNHHTRLLHRIARGLASVHLPAKASPDHSKFPVHNPRALGRRLHPVRKVTSSLVSG